MGFTEDMASVDADVFALLGDDLLYREGGSQSALYLPLKGFIATAEETVAYGLVDPARPTKRIKVRTLLVPNPTEKDRWKGTLLGAGIWQMTNRELVTAGRDWLIELKKASIG